jgi:hypothetical protein
VLGLFLSRSKRASETRRVSLCIRLGQNNRVRLEKKIVCGVVWCVVCVLAPARPIDRCGWSRAYGAMCAWGPGHYCRNRNPTPIFSWNPTHFLSLLHWAVLAPLLLLLPLALPSPPAPSSLSVALARGWQAHTLFCLLPLS